MACEVLLTILILEFRKGLYPIKTFPQISGSEASGTIAALPTDPAVLNDEQFKLRGLKLGSRVAVVCLCVLVQLLIIALQLPLDSFP